MDTSAAHVSVYARQRCCPWGSRRVMVLRLSEGCSTRTCLVVSRCGWRLQLLPDAAYKSQEKFANLVVVATGLVRLWSPEQAHLGSVQMEPWVGRREARAAAEGMDLSGDAAGWRRNVAQVSKQSRTRREKSHCGRRLGLVNVCAAAVRLHWRLA